MQQGNFDTTSWLDEEKLGKALVLIFPNETFIHDKVVTAKTKEVVKELQDRKTYFYDSNTSNSQDFYISDFVNVKYH